MAYLPPPGRPISSPPDFTSTTEPTPKKRGRPLIYTADIRAAIIAEHAAGKNPTRIARERGMNKATVQRIVGYNPPPRAVVAPAPREWSVKDTAAWAVAHTAGTRQSFKDEERKARQECARLNKTETRGTWLTKLQCVSKGLCKTPSGAEQRCLQHGWERRKWRAGARIAILLVPHDDAWGRKLAAMAAAKQAEREAEQTKPVVGVTAAVVNETMREVMAAVTTPPPPTLWQRAVNRIVGWFR